MTEGCDQRPCGVTAGWFLWVGSYWVQLKMIHAPPKWLNSRWPQWTETNLKDNSQDESYPVLQIPHKPGFPTLFSSSSLVLLVSKQARPILCSMSSWCCCGLWVWPRLHGRTVSSSAPAWMRTPVFYQFIRGLDVAQGCWPVLLLPACKTAPVNIINIRYASSFSVYTCVCVKKQHPEEIFSAQGLLFHCSGDGIYSSRFFYVRT